ncbi:MAG: 4Fe-4S binding protein [Holosporaceae bacterium]|jgi:ferredoxin|nr:4Fe-4S binding protein [Holosporaceae bacterium]
MRIIPEKCKRCLACIDVCPVMAIFQKGEEVIIDKDKCVSCGCCASSCPIDAIEYD